MLTKVNEGTLYYRPPGRFTVTGNLTSKESDQSITLAAHHNLDPAAVLTLCRKTKDTQPGGPSKTANSQPTSFRMPRMYI